MAEALSKSSQEMLQHPLANRRQRRNMSDETKAAPIERDELEQIKGRLLVVETALAKLIWRGAWSAADPEEWMATYRRSLEREAESWRRVPPMSEAAMQSAHNTLDEILFALREGEAARRGRTPNS